MSDTITMPAMPDRPCPRVMFSDEQIKQYLPDGVEGMNVGDEITLNVKAKVVELSKAEEPDYENMKNGEKPKKKMRQRVELELVGGKSKTDGDWDEQKRRLSKNMESAMKQMRGK